jgi:MFS family permease
MTLTPAHNDNNDSVPALLSRSPMHVRQFIAVALCCLINLADGYDVVSLALAAPLLTREWGVTPAALGIAFSAASVGLVLGAILIAPLADQVGRRPIVLAALSVITLAHGCLALSSSIWGVVIFRLAMGAGLGALSVTLNVLVAEFSNDRWRNVLLAVLHCGLSLGAAVGGATAVMLIEPHGWRSIFVVGAVLNLVLMLIALFVLMESPAYLIGRQPGNALARANAILRLLQHPPLQSLPRRRGVERARIGIAALLTSDGRKATVLIGITSFAYAVVGFFLLNWKPHVVVNDGLTPTQASYVGIVAGVFGILGHLSIGLLSRWVDEAKLTAIYFTLLAVTLVVFAAIPSSAILLLGISGLLTLFSVGAYTGLFLVAIKSYSAEMRSAGVGFLVGWGRVGAIIGPMLGGMLIGAELGRGMTFTVFATIALIPVMTMFLVVRCQGSTGVFSGLPGR